ncbi:MAG: tRNA epoxyqueuosine(34) reductase QueG [Symbiobacteriia bacterium]
MSLAAELKAEGRRLGLDLVGIASAEPFAAEVGLLAERRANGYGSSFESKDIGLRTDPARLLPGVRSIIAAGLNYYLPDGPEAGAPAAVEPAEADAPPASGGVPLPGWLSRYARGQVDYHRLLNAKLAALGEFLQQRVPGCQVQVHVDTGPPLDRAVAVRAGLGWYGKHAQLITREYASWVFLGELLTDALLQPDQPVAGTCGSCERCLTACPTGAIIRPGVIDASRCLSNVTQLKGFLPREYRRALGNRIFGCDDCLDACPHNVRAKPAMEPGLQPNPEVGGLPDLVRLLHMTRGEFKRWFAGGAAGWRGKTVLQRNAVVALGNSGDPAALPWLLAALIDGRPVIRGHAAWALAELARSGAAAAEPVRERLAALTANETDAAVQDELSRALADLEGHKQLE